MKKVLIIKPAYSETLDPDDSGIVSLGDILRSTVILNLFPPSEYEVTWLVDKKGAALLKDNPNIDRVLVINLFTPQLLLSESYDTLINLEKDLGICAMCENIHAWERYGFRLHDGKVTAHQFSEEALKYTQDPEAKRNKTKNWSEILYDMLGYTYQNEQYILGYKPKSTIKYDIGLNYKIGAKFPTKSWANWEGLEKALWRKSVSWQEGDGNLEEYFEWIASCGTIVTNDSLGLHIALAMNKKVVALFGPTLASEVPDSPNMIKLESKTGDVKSITIEDVVEAVEKLNGL